MILCFRSHSVRTFCLAAAQPALPLLRSARAVDWSNGGDTRARATLVARNKAAWVRVVDLLRGGVCTRARGA